MLLLLLLLLLLLSVVVLLGRHTRPSFHHCELISYHDICAQAMRGSIIQIIFGFVFHHPLLDWLLCMSLRAANDTCLQSVPRPIHV